MSPAEAHLWSCARPRVKATAVAQIGHAWRLTISLECGHQATQDFVFPSFASSDRLRATASELKRNEALRAENNIKRVGTAPCLACGPAS